MSSKRLIASAALVMALLTTSPAFAAPAKWAAIDVTVHAAEAGGATLLVAGTLPDSVALPADVELPVPAGAEPQWAGEILGGAVADDPTVTYTKTAALGQDVYRFRLTKSRTGQIEVAAPGLMTASGDRSAVAVEWTPTQDVGRVTMNVRIPAGAKLEAPAENASLIPSGETGYSYYSKPFENVKAGTPLEFSFAYTAGPVSAANAGAQGGGSTPIVVVTLLLFGLGVFLVVVTRVSRSSRAMHAAEDAAEAADETGPVDELGPDDGPEASEDPPAPGGPRRSHVIRGVVVLAALGIVLAVAYSRQPGSTATSGDTLTNTISTAEPKASVSFDITLRGEGDPAHESEHVFEALQIPGVASASFDTKRGVVVVRYDDAVAKESDIRTRLAQAGYVRPTPEDAVAATPSADGKRQEIRVEVGEALEPPFMKARAGVPLTLEFGQGAAHLATITIDALGVRKDLTKGGATVEIASPKAGTYEIVCGEGYTDGTLIVE